MILIQDFAGIGAIADDDLNSLIQARLDELRQYELPLADLARFIIIQPGDTLADIDTCLGYAILSNRWTGTRYGQPGFTPSWEVIEEHPHWYEMVFVISDGGYGKIQRTLKIQRTPTLVRHRVQIQGTPTLNNIKPIGEAKKK